MEAADAVLLLGAMQYQSLLNETKKPDPETKRIARETPPSCAAYFDDKPETTPKGPNPKATMQLRTICY